VAKYLFLVIALAFAACATPQRKPIVDPAAVSAFDASRFDAIEPLIQNAIAEGRLPGAVVLVGLGERTVYQKAIGRRALVQSPEPMTPDTIFDLASLTKVVATTTSVMILIDEGKIGLNDRVAAFIPGFERHGKGNITIRQLMTHVSGLRPDVDLVDAWSGYDTAIRLAVEEVPTAAPGTRFVYSDINFFLLGDIVKRVSGVPLDRFSHERIFAPLGMSDTGFTPAEPARARIAPTGDMTSVRGVVHDPTARRMGGVAGHAGLFGTAADLATYCKMILGGGAHRGVRIL
jgi:CubicO group peptidase (beta-lactamase class C family)